MMLPRTRPIRFPHDRGVLLAFHLLLCQSPMTRATSRGGEVCILVSSSPTPDSANKGNRQGFAVTSAISPSVTTLRLLCGFSYIHTLNYTESNCIRVVGGSKMPYTGPNTSIYSIICTYYLQLPVTEIHPLHSPPPDCSAVSNLNRRATKLYPLGGYQKIEKM